LFITVFASSQKNNIPLIAVVTRRTKLGDVIHRLQTSVKCTLVRAKTTKPLVVPAVSQLEAVGWPRKIGSKIRIREWIAS